MRSVITSMETVLSYDPAAMDVSASAVGASGITASGASGSFSPFIAAGTGALNATTNVLRGGGDEQEFTIQLDTGRSLETTLTRGVFIEVERSDQGENEPLWNGYIVRGWHENGGEYTQESPLVYDSRSGESVIGDPIEAGDEEGLEEPEIGIIQEMRYVLGGNYPYIAVIYDHEDVPEGAEGVRLRWRALFSSGSTAAGGQSPVGGHRDLELSFTSGALENAINNPNVAYFEVWLQFHDGTSQSSDVVSTSETIRLERGEGETPLLIPPHLLND